MYENLIGYIGELSMDKCGEWSCDVENDGILEQPICIPYVKYSRVAENIQKEVYKIVDTHKELNLTNYIDILGKNGLEWSIRSMAAADVSKMDDQCILALLVGAVRADRFCEGAYNDFLKSGCILKWLNRLKEIDK